MYIFNLFAVRDCLIENIESKQYGNVPEDTEKVGGIFHLQEELFLFFRLLFKTQFFFILVHGMEKHKQDLCLEKLFMQTCGTNIVHQCFILHHCFYFLNKFPSSYSASACLTLFIFNSLSKT